MKVKFLKLSLLMSLKCGSSLFLYSLLKFTKLKFVSILIIFSVVIVKEQAFAQQVPLHNELNYRIEKDFFSSTHFHSNVKPFNIKKDLYFDSLKNLVNIHSQSQAINKLLNSKLINFKKKHSSLSINPIISIVPAFNSLSGAIINNYQFGLSLNGNFTEKLSFSFNGFYGLKSFTGKFDYFVDSTNVIPHFGKLTSKNDKSYNYYSFNGYILYQPWKYINFQLAKGKNFWGEGYRSLFLSDNSNSYPYFKVTVDIWKFKYIWMVGSLNDVDTEKPSNELFSKLQFSHYLSWNATKWLNFNFFESIVSNPTDSMGVNYFNINYLNPVIFFRPVEFAGGSADNAIMGIGFKLKLLKKYQFYSQFIIDEFVFSEIKSRNGWWGNKYGIQLGTKVFNVLNINNLLLLAEYNLIRPFTYSYSNSIQNYGNYQQAMAHPSGANIKEVVALLHYHKKRFSTQFKAVYQISGNDMDTISYGKNIYKSYNLRNGDYEHYTTQGLLTKFLHVELKAGWLVNPYYNTQIQFSIATSQTNNNKGANNISLLFGIKTLIFNEDYDFQ